MQEVKDRSNADLQTELREKEEQLETLTLSLEEQKEMISVCCGVNVPLSFCYRILSYPIASYLQGDRRFKNTRDFRCENPNKLFVNKCEL